MKHIKTFESYLHSINEATNWGNGANIDMAEFTENVGDKNTAKKLLQTAKPFPLTGNVKKDGEKLITLASDVLGKKGVKLDIANVEVTSENFANEIIIPITGVDPETCSLQTNLDYIEMFNSGNGSSLEVQFSFYTEENGNLDGFDISNPAAVMKAVSEVKTFM